MDSSSSSSMDRVRTQVLTRHLKNHHNIATNLIHTAPCVSYSPPELSEPPLNFNTKLLRELLDGQSIAEIDYMFNLMVQSDLFCPRERSGKLFISPDFNQSMEQQRDDAEKNCYLREQGALNGWFSKKGPEGDLWRCALAETVSVSLSFSRD